MIYMSIHHAYSIFPNAIKLKTWTPYCCIELQRYLSNLPDSILLINKKKIKTSAFFGVKVLCKCR